MCTVHKDNQTAMNRLAGRRLREGRERLGITQTQMGELLGVRFQQVQKYENGTDRLPLSRAILAAKAFGVPLDYFSPEGTPLPAIEPGLMLFVRDLLRLSHVQRDGVRRLVRTLAREA